MPVSLYGQTADMDKINEIAKKHNLVVIEDAAQSFGATYKGKRSCNLSDFGCTSFFPSKPLGCYGSKERYNHTVVGINGRLDAIQAAILNVKLSHFDKEIEKRAEIAQKYIDLLSDKQIRKPVIKTNRTSVYAQFTLQSSNREEIIEKLKKNDIPTAIHYPRSLHLQKCFEYLNYSIGDFPVSEKASKEVFSLPMSPFLNDDQIEYITSLI